MAYYPEYPNWTPVNYTAALGLTCSTNEPGKVYTFATGSLPDPLKQLPGLSAAFISGYCSTYQDRAKVDVLGELVVARSADGTGKAYVYFVGISASTVHFAGPYKPPEGHYFDPGKLAPLDKLFGKSPPPERPDLKPSEGTPPA